MDYEIYIGGEPLCAPLGLVVETFTSPPPERKLVKVDIPMGSNIDITDAFGEAYEDRVTEMTLVAAPGEDGWQANVDALVAAIHGRWLKYSLSWDEGKEYAGRWAVQSVERIGKDGVRYGVRVDGYP